MKEYRILKRKALSTSAILFGLGLVGVLTRQGRGYFFFGIFLLFLAVYYYWRSTKRKIVVTDEAVIEQGWGKETVVPWNMIVAVYTSKGDRGLQTRIRYATNRETRKRLLKDDLSSLDFADVTESLVLKIPEQYEDFQDLLYEIVQRVDEKVFLDEYTPYYAMKGRQTPNKE